jgi:hypothetical protein
MNQVNFFITLICFLACFPAEKYGLVRNRIDKAGIWTRGISAVVSPLACFLALWQYGGIAFGDAVFISLVPVTAWTLDWFNGSTAYTDDRPNAWLRGGLLVISFMTALYASLLSEASALQKAANEEQAKLADQNTEVKALKMQIEDTRAVIAANDQRLAQKALLAHDKANAEASAYLEETVAQGGINPINGKRLRGGAVCGDNCNTYKAVAKNAQDQIDALTELEAQNSRLKGELATTEQRLSDLMGQYIKKELTPGELLSSVRYAPIGVASQIVGRVAVLMFLEGFSLMLAHKKASPLIRGIVQQVSEEDSARAKTAHLQEMAKIQLEHAAERSKIAATLPPISVKAYLGVRSAQLNPGKPASNDDGNEAGGDYVA